jgi:hypothetical protein
MAMDVVGGAKNSFKKLKIKNKNNENKINK